MLGLGLGLATTSAGKVSRGLYLRYISLYLTSAGEVSGGQLPTYSRRACLAMSIGFWIVPVPGQGSGSGSDSSSGSGSGSGSDSG